MHRDDLPVPSPCHADWEAMNGDARKRFCDACTKHVHDLSELTLPEAVSLLQTSPLDEQLCVRYRTSQDGEVVFQEACEPQTSQRTAHKPRPRRRHRLRAALTTLALTAATPAMAGVTLAPEANGPACEKPSRVERLANWAWSWWEDEAAPIEEETWIQGDVAVPPEVLPTQLELVPEPEPEPVVEEVMIQGQVARMPELAVAPETTIPELLSTPELEPPNETHVLGRLPLKRPMPTE